MYDNNKVDKKWQEIWEKERCFNAKDDFTKEKFYSLVEFPYPSGAGMHVGHIRAYMGMDVISRMKRMQGYNVLFPIGFDAFGLPTENYAMKTGIHPRKVTDDNIATFTKQLKSVGFSFDYDRVVDTTKPEYFKWTQWIFLKLFEHGLAYKDKTFVNYCPKCRVILANEESQGGVCDRCDSEIIQKEKEVWMLKITDYADKLLDELSNVDFPERVKAEQENWIGRSYGAEIDFNICSSDKKLTVYTTRPDTIFGVTYMAIAPEHKILDELKDKITNFDEVEKYKLDASKKSELERTKTSKDKTGVIIQGVSVINPVTLEKIPLVVTDYVMLGYGTGAIMAVPAHDDRDFDFAKKFNLDIKQVIAPIYINSGKDAPKKDIPFEKRETVCAIIEHPNNDECVILDWKEELGWKSFVIGGIEKNETVLDAAKREVAEETGYVDIKDMHIINAANYNKFFAGHKNINREAIHNVVVIKLNSLKLIPTDISETKNHKFRWVEKSKIYDTLNLDNQKFACDMYLNEKPFIGEGILINSEFLNGLSVKEAQDKIICYLEEKNIGHKKTNYHMKDWAFARQRYWGEPMPIVKCPHCGLVPLKESDLPLELPVLENFIPGEDGESPLAKVESWVNCKCPKCNMDAKRETDTMPQWAGSSWYFLRYIDPNNSKEFAGKDKLKYWLQVDQYNGGMEHVTRHLIYSRFWHRFLYDIGLVPTKEPYAKRSTQGLILGPDGNKMSKSKGNVVNPDDIVKEYGADTLRTYILFIGDYSMSAPWSLNGVKGAKKFLDRVMRLKDFAVNEDITVKELDREMHLMIKKVTEDYLSMKYNTAIACMMSYVNLLYKQDKVSIKYIKPLLLALNPVAPHVTEELWEELGLENHIFSNSWPVFDESKMIKDDVEMAVLINGVVRYKITVNNEMDEKEIENIAINDEKLNNYLIDGKSVKKVIVVKGRVVNIVIG